MRIGGRQSVGKQEVALSGSTGCKPYAAALMFRRVTKLHDPMRAGHQGSDHRGIWPMRQIRGNTGKLRDEELELLDFIIDARSPMAHMAYPGNYRLKTLDQDLSYVSMLYHSNLGMEYFIPNKGYKYKCAW
jgi:hypothetical protein